MVENGVRFLRLVKAEPDFIIVIFQVIFCSTGEATELGKTVQNYTK